MYGLCGLDTSAEDLADAEHEQGVQDQEVGGAAVKTKCKLYNLWKHSVT